MQDFLNIIDCFPESPCYYINKCLSCGFDLTPILNLSVNEQIRCFSKMKDVLFQAIENSVWDYNTVCDNEFVSLNDIRKDVVDISKLRFHKSSFVLTVDNTDGLNIYDEFKVNINSYYKTDLNGNRYDLCDDAESAYLKNDITTANCIITKIDRLNNKVSITTDYETVLYNNTSIDTDIIDIAGTDMVYNVYVFENNCGLYNDITDKYVVAHGSVIGDISGEIYKDDNLSGYGVYLKDNCYILNSNISLSDCDNLNISDSKLSNTIIENCNIINEYIYIETDDLITLDVSSNKNYSIKNNGVLLVDLPASTKNGIIINIYAVNDIGITANNTVYRLSSGEHTTFVNVPTSRIKCEWIKINNNVEAIAN